MVRVWNFVYLVVFVLTAIIGRHISSVLCCSQAPVSSSAHSSDFSLPISRVCWSIHTEDKSSNQTISSLQHRKETLSINFFHKILEPSSCLHYLIPNKRCNSQLLKLRNHSLHSPPFTRTKKFKSSFFVHALYHYVYVLRVLWFWCIPIVYF